MIEVKHKDTGETIFQVNAETLEGARLYRAQLRGADLARLNLRSADLRAADLAGADLQGAELRGANLEPPVYLRDWRWVLLVIIPYAFFSPMLVPHLPIWVYPPGALLLLAAYTRIFVLFRTRANGADLTDANLSGAQLRYAYLRGARLVRADLRGADLFGTDLVNADLQNADLRQARLRPAFLRGADLRGTNLAETDLRSTALIGARYDRNTVWPPGFDPQKRGAQLVD